jgi:flagellar biosynthesis protein FliR
MINELSLYYTNFLMLLLVIVRLTLIFSISGIFNIFSFPNNIKIIFIFLLSTIVYTQQDLSIFTEPFTSARILEIVLMDLISSIIIGFILKVVIESYKIYGEALSYASGLSMSTFYDPSGGISHVYTPFLKFLFICAVLLIDGHHVFIKGVIESFHFLPLGTMFNYFEINSFWEIVQSFIYIFSIIFFSTLPFMFIAVSSDLFFAFATKSMPAFNIFAIGIQTKILIIMVLFYFSLPFIFELFINILTDLNWIFN